MKRVLFLIFCLLLIPAVFAEAGDSEKDAEKFIKAAGKGDLVTVQTLVNDGADVNAKDKNCQTALINASSEGHAEVVKLLLDRGAETNARDKLGWTALMNASLYGRIEVVKLLLDKGANAKMISEGCWTALMMARKYGCADIEQLLKEIGADERDSVIIEAASADQNAELFQAAQDGNLVTVQTLLDKGADINEKDINAVTALYIASQNGHADVVRLLLEKGADVNIMAEIIPKPQVVDSYAKIYCVGSTALKMAKDMGRTDIAEMLESAGAKE